MDIRCIVLDMDRTTLDANGKLSAGNKTAIEYAISRGVEVVIASGRSFASLPEDVTGIPGIRYAITSNGAAVYNTVTSECLIRHLIGGEAVDRILNLVSEPVKSRVIVCEGFIDGVPYCPGHFYAHPDEYGLSERHIKYVKSTRRPEDDILAFIREHRLRLESVDIMTWDMVMKKSLWKQLENEVGDIYITTSADNLLEISDKNSGKHSAVHYLLDLLQIGREETAAFGDGDNDAGMLSYVGAGVAVENASERCKQSADYIT
ncbi:MAG: Cof-type HAD-IIB family hydrolase, partial [Clostridia bacterium]|nr:Cof-type HAD-IIB family hydrolase [Clostridia bacterium]